MTNKVTEEERAAAKHHLIDFVDPLSRLTVVDFRQKALAIVSDCDIIRSQLTHL